MSNKDIFKKMYSNKFDKDGNYKKILERIGEKEKKNKILKYAFVPTFVTFLICGVFIFSNDNWGVLKTKPSYHDEIIINNKSSNDLLKLDAKLKDIERDEIIEKFNLKQISIPDRYKLSHSYAVYIREYRDYNILHDYVLCYEEQVEKQIKIAISEIEEPIRDYHFNTEGDKESIINGKKLFISKYNDSYIATFKKSNSNFDIETTGITEEELINLLKSII